MALNKQLSKCMAISELYFSFQVCVWPYHVNIKCNFIFYKSYLSEHEQPFSFVTYCLCV